MFRIWGQAVGLLRRGIEKGATEGDWTEALFGVLELTGLSRGLPAGWLLDAAERTEREDSQEEGRRGRRRGTSRRGGSRR